MKKIFAILPCYNEEENIGKLIEEWNKQSKKLHDKQYDLKIVAIDDCSTDSTNSKILEKKTIYSNVDIIIHEKNKGLCGGLNSALEYFHSKGEGGDLLVLMDGDNTHDPKYVHSMLELIENGNDCVIASRYCKDSNIVGLAKSRERMSGFAKLYYSAILKIPNVKDYTSGYRIYTYQIIDQLLAKFGKEPIKEKSFACMMELLYKLYVVGAKFEEVGFELRYDKKCGESKMKVVKTAQRSIITALKLKFKYDKGSIICLMLILIFSIFLSLTTNYSPINLNILSHDCGIFSYVGFAMQKGRVLYTEIWENKGPLLYFIYFFGLVINKQYGIYILELISIFVSLLFGYKTIKLITNKNVYAILGIIYTFSVYGVTFEKGTFSENFALPLVFVGLYLFTRQILKKQRTENITIILWGILTGGIALLRLNMLSIFLAFFIVIGLDLILKKSFKEIFRWLGFGILGVAISAMPFAIYLIANNALFDCINIAYLDILNGFNSGTWIDKLRCLKDMLVTFNISGASIFLLVFLILSPTLIIDKSKQDREKKLYIFSAVLAIIFNSYANSISGAYQMHYMLTFIPIIAMLTGIAASLYDKINIKYAIKVLVGAIVVVFISFSGYKFYSDMFEKQREENKNKEISIQIVNYIRSETNCDDTVQMIGGRGEAVGANYSAERLAPSKYSYLPLWPSFTKERKRKITNELVEEVQNNLPKLIFICKYNNNANEFYELIDDKERWNEFIEKNYEPNENIVDYYIVYNKR